MYVHTLTLRDAPVQPHESTVSTSVGEKKTSGGPRELDLEAGREEGLVSPYSVPSNICQSFPRRTHAGSRSTGAWTVRCGLESNYGTRVHWSGSPCPCRIAARL
jgi:hypothetical protein